MPVGGDYDGDGRGNENKKICVLVLLNNCIS
jgi:hypothetical protein